MSGRRVLILNWRDVRSPRAGGAELLTHELAKHLVTRRGDHVTWFTSRPRGASRTDAVDGVSIVRYGTELTTRLHAPRFTARQPWDLVIEEINTLPWLSPIWARTRTLLLIPQLARNVWWYEAKLPLALLGYAAEPAYLSAYRRTEAVTVSHSTLTDLRRIGLHAPIHVIPMASSAPALTRLPPKTPGARLAVVGRLVRSKRVDHAIRALSRLRRSVPDASLVVVGDGPERGELLRLADELRLREAVEFAGRVSEPEKTRLLADATILVSTAVREGWGLTVTEAARVGTPSVCYRIPGLRDSVVHGRTGILTDPSPDALADGAAALLAEPARYQQLREAAWRHSADLSWERTGEAFANVVDDVIGRGGD
jgi:glycosyltransferase involved in cell wall biosynthesis